MPSKFVCLIVFAAGGSVLSACSNAETPAATASSKVQPWRTACVGRLLIDLPADVELSAGDLKHSFAQTFTGIRDFAGNGIFYRGIEIAETHPVDAAAFKEFSQTIIVTSPTPTYFTDTFYQLSELKKGFESDRKRATTPEQKAEANEQLRIVKKKYDDAVWGKKVSGSAKSVDATAFAVRDQHTFKVAYFDEQDSRVRFFAGELPKQSADSPEAAALMLKNLRSVYTSRAATEVSNLGPGFCTPHGFVDESKGELPVAGKASLSFMFRSRANPALVFRLEVKDGGGEKTASIQDMPDMLVNRAELDPIGIKKTVGPTKVVIMGTPGRSIGYRYGDNCSKTSCRPADQLYAIEAETFGEAGRVDRPHLILHMTGLTSDQFRAAQGQEVMRPGLKGIVPPPFEEAVATFDHILKSIRPRAAR